MKNTYSIQQVTQITGLSTHTLRYYEKIGLLSGIHRNEQGYRLSTEQDLSWIDFLLRLRETGMPIHGMIRFSELRSLGDATVTERRQMLEHHEAIIEQQIRKLRENKRRIRDKIHFYQNLEERMNEAGL
ncbi:MerR family transcriptional regulator [Paenibacillus sp. JX-17]|uniref:MerR family transcriptional regulator n=1 Tax=Paenibacillus lacisoli TaxID=3064525 RepID=A0ABT9CH85_9BACL|nr:MerR family transcriptional regulator [Paenibacillus sp. JX-17]MDO7908644.1 MerR family transcriptional regulator [Paenibacillus sp. JX-17]